MISFVLTIVPHPRKPKKLLILKFTVNLVTPISNILLTKLDPFQNLSEMKIKLYYSRNLKNRLTLKDNNGPRLKVSSIDVFL